VPDFGAKLGSWQASPEHAVIVDMTVRGDPAIKKACYMAAREWLPEAGAYRHEFLIFAKGLGIQGYQGRDSADPASVRQNLAEAAGPRIRPRRALLVSTCSAGCHARSITG
jgi:hypothetical protein